MKAVATFKWNCGCKAGNNASATLDTAADGSVEALKLVAAMSFAEAVGHIMESGHTVETKSLVRNIDKSTHPGNLYYREGTRQS